MGTALYIVVLIFVFVLGATVGSFLNVVIYRLPRKEGFFSGSPVCPHCKHTLSAPDLVPLLSYLFLGGRCRYCKEHISARYMFVEGLTGLLALVSYLAFLPPGGFLIGQNASQLLYDAHSAQELGLMAPWLPFDLPGFCAAVLAAMLVFFVLCLLVVVTFIDADTMEIPNSLSMWLAAVGIISFAFGPTASLPWYDHLIGAACVSVPMLALACMIVGSFGLGDVKLMAAAGLFLGWQLCLAAVFIGIVLGGVYGIYLLATRKKSRKEHFAFGPALCAGISLSMFCGQGIIAWYTGFF